MQPSHRDDGQGPSSPTQLAHSRQAIFIVMSEGPAFYTR